MEAWVLISIAAAFFQTLRFMLQKHLATDRLSATGATFARFVFSAPLIVVAMLFYGAISGQSLPLVSARFGVFAAVGGISQILATVAVVALFSERNFAVGITFKKTEVILTALVGFLVLGRPDLGRRHGCVTGWAHWRPVPVRPARYSGKTAFERLESRRRPWNSFGRVFCLIRSRIPGRRPGLGKRRRGPARGLRSV